MLPPPEIGVTPPNFTDELVFADPDCTCHEACIETIPKRYGKYNQEPMLRYSDSIRTAMLPPGATCTELKIRYTRAYSIMSATSRCPGQASAGMKLK
jgi:hypothetical protein